MTSRKAGRNLRDQLLQILKTVEAGFAWIDEHRDEIRAFWDRAKDDERHGAWGYLVSRVDAFTGISIRLALEMRRSFNGVSPDQLDEPLAEIISRGLTEPGTIEAVLESVARAPLPEAKKQQLTQGLRFLVSTNYHLAVPMLIGPLEGAFWNTAQALGLIWLNDSGHWVTTAKTSKAGVEIDAIEKLSKLHALQVDPKFGAFLRGVAYGGEGHPYRHGSADDRWRVRALCLLVALVGWLEFAEVMNASEVIRGGFLRAEKTAEAERGSLFVG